MQIVQEAWLRISIPAIRTVVIVIAIREILRSHLSFVLLLLRALHVAEIVPVPFALVVPIIAPMSVPVVTINIVRNLAIVVVLTLLGFLDVLVILLLPIILPGRVC